MSDPRPYEFPRSNAETRVFRARPWIRKTMVALAGFTVVFAIGLAAFSAYSMIQFNEPFLSIFTGFYVSQIVVGLVLVASAVYWARYWLKYRIVVDDQFISREGLPHLVDRRKRIAFTDVLRVTHGTRNVLKIVPKEGYPLAVGLKGLDADPTALLVALRERIPENRFDADLESSIFQGSSSDRLGYIVSAGLVLGTVASLGGIYVRNPVLERTAWHGVSGLEDDLRIELVDTAGDNSIWVVAEEHQGGNDDEIGLTHVRPDGTTETMGLSAVPAMKDALARARNAGPFPIDSMAIDPQNRPWLVLRGDQAAYFWDGEDWNQVPATSEDLDFEITDLVRAEDFLWALVPEHNGLFRIEPESLDTVAMGPLSWEYETETIELRPFDLRGSSGDGAVVFGELSTGRPGFVAIAGDGSIAFSSEVLGAPSAATWRAHSATPDNHGQIHLLYNSRDVCVEGRRLIKLGTRLASTEWVWRDLVYQADCGVDPMFDEIQIDLQGRVWIKPNDGNVMVFPGPGSGNPGGRVDPLAVYSRDNSGYNGGQLVMGADGHLLAVSGGRRSLVMLDASGTELPTPLPAWFAWYFEHPYVAQIAALLLILPFLIALARRNFKR